MTTVQLTNALHDEIYHMWIVRNRGKKKSERIPQSKIIEEALEDQKKYKKIMEGVN